MINCCLRGKAAALLSLISDAVIDLEQLQNTEE